MKIQDMNQRIQMDAYVKAAQGQQQQNQVKGQSAQQQSSMKGDRVDISQGSKLLNKVNGSMSTNDPERAAKVQALKDQVQNGTYKAQPDKIANAMLNDMLKNLG